MILRYLFVLLALGFMLPSIAQTYYVSSGASGTGSSWADASGDLKQILDNANAGDQVWVAAGTYYPTSCNPCATEQRLQSFQIPDSVAVYGGFEGFELSLEERNWINNPSILSGDIDQDNNIENNANTIVLFTRVSAMTILDGFTIANAYAHLENASSGEKENSGGAIFNQGGLQGNISHPKISNCTFSNNHALGYGGAIFNNGSFNGNASPVLENCIFLNNVSGKGGGAICNQASFDGTTLMVLEDCRFLSNHVNEGDGGAIYNQGAKNGDASLTFLACYFEGNTTSGYGGAVQNNGREGKSNSSFENCTFLNNEALFGGAVNSSGTLNGLANTTYVDCHFEGNHSMGDGGAVHNWGSEGTSNASFTDCLFQANRSDFAGAGIFNNGIDGITESSVLNCRFIMNVATTYGGAMYNNGKRGRADAMITNCLFQKNDGNSAGAVYNLGSENGTSSPTITNCTFYGNTANVGAAVYNNASDSTGTSNPIITNCIFWKNEAEFGDVFRNILSTPFIQYSVVDQVDCNSMNSGIGSNVSCGEGVLYEVYPKFVDTLSGNFRLKEDSPLLDIGDNVAINATGVDFDLDRQVRIFNTTVDLGAFEFFENYTPPSIVLQPQSVIPCEGENVLLSIIAAGTPPLAYQWFRDGSPIENATETELLLSAVDPDDTGGYYCSVTSAMGDGIESDFADVVVESTHTPAILIIDNPDVLCEGATAFFVADAFNGGAQPIYNWSLNGNPVGGNTNSLELENVNDGDQLQVELISSLNCAMPSVIADSIEINVEPIVVPFIEITGPDSLVCIGDSLSFEALPENGGLNPMFQWQINGDVIFGQNTNIFVTDELTQDDSVSCMLISSEACPTQSSVLSNAITVQTDSCNLTSLTQIIIEDIQIHISPNPSSGTFQVHFEDLKTVLYVEVYDIKGQILHQQVLDLRNTSRSFVPFILDTSGVYFLRTYNNKMLNVQKIIIQTKE